MRREGTHLHKGAFKIHVFANAGMVFEEKSRIDATPRRRFKKTPCASHHEAIAAFEARVAALVAEGWVDQQPARQPARKAATRASALEASFATLARDTIARLQASTSEAADAKIWRAAVGAYGKLKVKAGGDRTENLVHFFAVDGIALEAKHPVVVRAVRATKARKARWIALLEAAR